MDAKTHLVALAMLGSCSGTSRAPPPDGGFVDLSGDAGPSTNDGAVGPGMLAAQYPGDVGIASDPAVVWAENFEEGSVASVTARYDSANNAPGMTLVGDVPTKSGGKASMRLVAGGAASATDLYKKLAKGYDELYVRWYAKYQAGAPWHHTGVWFGGYNPALAYPNPQAGIKPTGDDRFSIAIEPVWGNGSPNPRFDFYNYWMNMHTCGSCAGKYWGNALVERNTFTAADDQWVCLEVHVRLNTDLGSTAGAALEVWKNDVLVQSYPETGGPGSWIQDHFCPKGADGPECNYTATAPGPLDLQLRSSGALQLNYFWPQNYVTDATTGTVQYDDMVLATTRIGCLR